jgi:hypothetical protein
MRLDRTFCMALAMLLFLMGHEVALAQDGTPPARAVLFDEPISETPAMVVSLGTATLRKGKPKHLLLVDVRLEVTSVLGSSLALVDSILVNGHGFAMREAAAANVCSTGIGSCAARGSAWVDLDQAEITYPGEFEGQPLEIEVTGRAESGDIAPSFRLRILGRLVKR